MSASDLANEYDPLPPDFFTKASNQHLEPVFIWPITFRGRNYFFPDDTPSPRITLNGSGQLTISEPWSALFFDEALKIQSDEDLPLYYIIQDFQILAKSTPQRHPAGRTLVQNVAKSVLLLARLEGSGVLDLGTLVMIAMDLLSIIQDTRATMESLPTTKPDTNVIPEGHVEVTKRLRTCLVGAGVDLYVICDFAWDHTFRTPLVVHPHIDALMHVFQLALKRAIVAPSLQYTALSAFLQCADAFCAVNDALFENSEDMRAKVFAFAHVFNEFRRLFHALSNQTDICSWIAITLIGPLWLQDFKSLCGHLKECVERITGRPFVTNAPDIDKAIEKDNQDIENLWKINLGFADEGLCRNPRTCEALTDFPDWVRKTLYGASWGVQIAKEARERLDRAKPGTYEYNALTWALYHIRRDLRPSLEEWEFSENEIRLGEPLGEGAFGAVRQCSWLDGTVAVKVFKESPTSSPGGSSLSSQDLDSYVHKRELTAWFRLSHPHVLPFMGCCITSPTPMILTPLAENGNARTYRESHPNADWLQILAQIASGLRYLHEEASLIHGDLKGRNVLMDADASPRIADFGLASMTQNVYGHSNLPRGTPQWMAPELLSRKGVLTYESDVYALGMTVYELWFNKDPFEMMEADLVAEMVVEEGIRPEKEAEPPIGKELWKMIEEYWDEDPSKRPSTARAHASLRQLAPRKGVEYDIKHLTIDDDDKYMSHDIPPKAPDEPVDSIEDLPCTHLHELPEFPKREDFPFISSGHLVSFAVLHQPGGYTHNSAKPGYIVLETTHDGIQGGSIAKIFIRVQTKTTRFGPWIGDGPLKVPSRLEAVLLRRSEDAGSWDVVPDATQKLMDSDPRCNSSVAHVFLLDRKSPLGRHIVAGDKVALQVTPDLPYKVVIENAEIEMHVLLDKVG